MNAFRYQATQLNGPPVKGQIQAPDRKSALQILGARGLFPSVLESCAPAPDSAAQPALAPRQRGSSGDPGTA